jgi:hypothetical protein
MDVVSLNDYMNAQSNGLDRRKVPSRQGKPANYLVGLIAGRQDGAGSENGRDA